ncbi:S8 family serine peptidase, partial [bacterium]|nr:S8 family serine peptidase [bacterium]
PYSGHWHGTHVAGLAAAVTNNQTGVAGSGYNCSIMISKHGNEVEGETGLWNVYSGIKYMADMGADIINCSFGGFLYSQFGAEMVAYAYSKGALVVAAAGNNDGQNEENKIWVLPETPLDSYPASYPFVLSVANLRNDDNFYSGSFWGSNVDICAPGINDLSTIKNNQYARATGTSMSSPVVAGVAALLKTQHPEWNPDQLTMQLKNTADDISNIGNNQAYIDAGGIGTGRLNALRAVSPEYQNRPKIGFEKIVIQETGDGNGNGVPDPGETINVVVGIVNTWADVQNLQGVLSTTDPTIEIVQNTTNYPYLLGFSAIGFNFADNSGQPFQVRIAEDALPHPSLLTMTVSTSSGYSETITIPFSVQNNILLVDDDNGVSTEVYYQDVLTDQGIGYTYWNNNRQGTPSAAMLGHKTILWVTEVDLPTLDSADRNWLVQAAANGNHLIITGPRISYDLGEAGISGNQYRYTAGRSYDFHQEYLHAELQSAETGHDRIFGIEGHPFTEGLTLNLRQPGHGAGTVLLPELLPTADAETIFSYSNGMAAAIHYSGADYKLFYLAFGGLETLHSKETRVHLLQGMLSSFSGLRVEFKDLPNTENHTLPYLFSAEIESDFGLAASKLFWKKEGDTDYNEIQLEMVGGHSYTAEIPVQPLGTVVD